jgi:hypothetical protein
MSSSRAADLVAAAFGAAILGATVLLATLARAGIDPLAGLRLCWSRLLFDRACPGCGLTRSFVAIANGDLARAFACNPTGPVVFAGIAIITAVHALRLAGARVRHAGRIDAAVGGAVLTTLILYGFHFYAG